MVEARRRDVSRHRPTVHTPAVDDEPLEPPSRPTEPPRSAVGEAARSTVPAVRLGRWPFGLVAVAILRLFDAIALIIVGVQPTGIPMRGIPVLFGNEALTRALDVAFALVIIVGVVGLLRFQRWGWVLTMVLVGVQLSGDMIRYAIGQPDYLAMLLHVVSVFYLNGRAVRALAYPDLTHAEPTLR